VLIYDPVADGWTAGASMPFSNRRHVAAALGGKIYATGGDTAAVQEYDPAADAWQMRAPLPTNRWYAVAGAVNGVLYVIGGGSSTGISDAHEAYVPPAP
jgi:N-acetylneuraminic acid mutarotase